MMPSTSYLLKQIRPHFSLGPGNSPPQPPSKCRCGAGLSIEGADKLGFGGDVAWVCRFHKPKEEATYPNGYHIMYRIEYDSGDEVTSVITEDGTVYIKFKGIWTELTEEVVTQMLQDEGE